MDKQQTTTCNQKVYQKERWGSFHGKLCGRPVKEGDKCGIHCASAKKRRDDKWKKDFESRCANEKLQQQNNAISLLKKNGFIVINPKGEKL